MQREPTPAELNEAFEAWLADRPPAVREAARKKPPWNAYRLKTTGQTCYLRAYEENPNGTCTTARVYSPPSPDRPISGILFPLGHEVFGVHLDDLVALD